MSALPALSTAWARTVSTGRFSTMLILDLALDEAELGDGKRDHDQHEDHRLRRRAAEIPRLDAVVVDLIDEDLGRAGGPALRGRIAHPERAEERIEQVDKQTE